MAQVKKLISHELAEKGESMNHERARALTLAKPRLACAAIHVVSRARTVVDDFSS